MLLTAFTVVLRSVTLCARSPARLAAACCADGDDGVAVGDDGVAVAEADNDCRWAAGDVLGVPAAAWLWWNGCTMSAVAAPPAARSATTPITSSQRV
jgi:hypothetical protein